MSDFPILHVYGQHCEHDEAFIIGTRDALLALRAAIDASLTQDHAAADVYAADGEGYDLIVKCLPEDALDLKSLPYQYLAELRKGESDDCSA